MEDRLTVVEARRRIRRAVSEGIVTYAVPHAIRRLEQRNICMVDCENVLRAGVVEEPEWSGRSWRYRVRTQRFVVVVEFLSENELFVVTAWRTS